VVGFEMQEQAMEMAAEAVRGSRERERADDEIKEFLASLVLEMVWVCILSLETPVM